MILWRDENFDGCALLWIPQWPSSTSTQKLINSNEFCGEVQASYSGEAEDLVFDRYDDFNINSSTRSSKMAEGCKVFQLSHTSPLHSQKVTLTITQSKKQLRRIQKSTSL